jgi:hypothetical protein
MNDHGNKKYAMDSIIHLELPDHVSIGSGLLGRLTGNDWA